MIRRLYNWMLTLAAHPHCFKILCFISFIESSFFPIPVYPLLMAVCMQNPRRSIHYALFTALASVAGAMLGYFIGFTFWEATKGFFFQYLFTEDSFNLVAEKYHQHTFLTILVASVTPIPFKVFTISAGALGAPIVPFLAGALLGRTPRFLFIGTLFYFWGDKAKAWIEKHFTTFGYVLSAVVIVAVAGYLLLAKAL